MKKLLTIKHWQFFILMVGAPLITYIVLIVNIIAYRNFKVAMVGFPTLMIFVGTLFYGWFYTLGTSLHKKLPDSESMSLTRFKIFLFTPVVYLLSIILFVALIALQVFSSGTPSPWIILIILPLHLFSMFCSFYTLYFNAKALKSVELQREVEFSDYAAEFFLLWFFPIGVWFLQPRINKLFQKEKEIVEVAN